MIKILKKMLRLELIRYVYFNDVHILWNTSMTKGVSRFSQFNCFYPHLSNLLSVSQCQWREKISSGYVSDSSMFQLSTSLINQGVFFCFSENAPNGYKKPIAFFSSFFLVIPFVFCIFTLFLSPFETHNIAYLCEIEIWTFCVGNTLKLEKFFSNIFITLSSL